MKRSSLLLLVIMVAVSCKDKDKIPADILPREKMQAVLWSMVSAGEFLNGYVLNKDSVDKRIESARVYGQVFTFYKITREQFDRSYSYYRERPELMKVILDSLTKRPPKTEEKITPKRDTSAKKLLKTGI